jgi:hypothetical protein
MVHPGCIEVGHYCGEDMRHYNWKQLHGS